MADRSPVLRFVGVSKRYGRSVAVEGLDLEVYPGELVALVGPDGAGKTTAARLAAGVILPSAGRVDFCQRGRAGYLSDRFRLYPDLTVRENVLFFGRVFGVRGRTLTSRVGQLLEQVNLHPFADRLAGQLSGGMRQKLALVCALIHEPPVLILDEPTTGLDPVARRDFWMLLRGVAESGTAALVTTPYMDEAEGCHQVGMLHRGRLLAVDTPAALKSRVPVLMALLRPLPGSRFTRRELLAVARGLAGARWAQQVGGGVRVALDPAGGSLPQPPPGMSLDVAGLSLEDVYIWLAGEVPA